jgi:hypothetical protein
MPMAGEEKSSLAHNMEVSMHAVRSPCSAAAARDVEPPNTKSVFPADAHALIYKPAHSVTMSAPKRRPQWRLQFERRSPLRVEPLMGWTEDDDPLTQVELSFPSAEAAVAYARRQGLRYTVLRPLDQEPPAPNVDRSATSHLGPARCGDLQSERQENCPPAAGTTSSPIQRMERRSALGAPHRGKVRRSAAFIAHMVYKDGRLS